MPCSVSCLATQPPLAPEPTTTASKSCLLTRIDGCACYHYNAARYSWIDRVEKILSLPSLRPENGRTPAFYRRTDLIRRRIGRSDIDQG